MLPRECDNDMCDYNEHGRWEHDPSCGPENKPPAYRHRPPTSFLATTYGTALQEGLGL